MRTHRLGGTWGDAIHISQWNSLENTRVYGWKTPQPVVGDRLAVPMQSGKIAICEFVEITPQRDPPDMFFADVKFLYYT